MPNEELVKRIKALCAQAVLALDKAPDDEWVDCAKDLLEQLREVTDALVPPSQNG